MTLDCRGVVVTLDLAGCGSDVKLAGCGSDVNPVSYTHLTLPTMAVV